MKGVPALMRKSSNETVIYLLLDTRRMVGYVGKTIHSPEQRRREHWKNRRKRETYKDRWLCKLRLPPQLVILEIVDDDSLWQSAERKWIRDLKAGGLRLTNSTAGGDGLVLHDPKVRRRVLKKMSASHKGQKAWNKGKPWSKRMRNKLSLAHQGQTFADRGSPSELTKKRISKTVKELWRDPEYRAKQKTNPRMLGKTHSEETKLKMSKAQKGKPSSRKGYKHSEETKRKISASHGLKRQATRRTLSKPSTAFR